MLISLSRHIKLILRTVLFVILVVLQACQASDYTITGEVEGLGTQNLRFLHLNNDALSVSWLPAVDGKFTFKGSSKHPVVMELYTKNMRPLTRFVIKNGENVKITGSMPPNGKIEVKGDKLSTQWNEWLEKNGGDALHDNIEKYVLNNRDSQLSALLLAYNYASPVTCQRAIELLDSLSDDAVMPFIRTRLEASVDGFFTQLLAADNQKPKFDFTLYSDADSSHQFSLTSKPVSLIYIWNENNAARTSVVKKLRKLHKISDRKLLQITDMGVQADTFAWKQIIKNDSATWMRYYAQGGIINPALAGMNVRNIPYFIVADSSGVILYRGTIADSALQNAERQLKTYKK